MKHVHFFRQNTVDALREKIKENLPWYRNETNTLPESIADGYGQMSQTVDWTCFEKLNENPKKEDDLKNTIAIYEALGGLSLQQAADERIWTYATHILAKPYTSQRWRKIPADDDDKAVQYIRSHYFVSGARGLIRGNAVSRLWWMGHLASRCQDYDLEATLHILLRESDVRANLIERSSLSMSTEIFSSVIRTLGKSCEASKEPEIYKRENFRSLMKRLNRRGGRIMLNALGTKQLDNMIDRMVEQVITNSSGKGKA